MTTAQSPAVAIAASFPPATTILVLTPASAASSRSFARRSPHARFQPWRGARFPRPRRHFRRDIARRISPLDADAMPHARSSDFAPLPRGYHDAPSITFLVQSRCAALFFARGRHKSSAHMATPRDISLAASTRYISRRARAGLHRQVGYGALFRHNTPASRFGIVSLFTFRHSLMPGFPRAAPAYRRLLLAPGAAPHARCRRHDISAACYYCRRWPPCAFSRTASRSTVHIAARQLSPP